jgi:L-asparaginase II
MSPSHVIATRETGAGPLVENRHRVHVAVVRPDGAVIASSGDPRLVIFARSAAKPLQALALAARPEVEVHPHELALACASHAGGSWATEPIAAWLARHGLTAEDLGCGTHPPLDAAARAAIGDATSALHHNCSGKHAGMLALSVALGHPPAGAVGPGGPRAIGAAPPRAPGSGPPAASSGPSAPMSPPPHPYLRLSHPVQLAIRAEVEALAGGPVRWAVDGCSAPTPAIALADLARAYARFAEAAEAVQPAAVAVPEMLARQRIWQAMRDHAELVAGPGLLDTAVMRALLGVIVKRGADGVEAGAALSPVHGPIGFALKVEDGASEARDVAVMALLEALGLLNPASRHALAPFIRPPRRNARGGVIGHLVAHLELAWTR